MRPDRCFLHQVFGLFEESQNDPRQFFEPMRRDGELKLKAPKKKNIDSDRLQPPRNKWEDSGFSGWCVLSDKQS